MRYKILDNIVSVLPENSPLGLYHAEVWGEVRGDVPVVEGENLGS